MSQMILNRTLRAEQSVLGGLMIDASQWPKIQQRLKAADFLAPEHQVIFNAIQRNLEAGKPVDPVTIGEIKGIDFTYLGMLYKDTPSAANVVHYADLVKQESERREIALMLADTQQSLVDGENPQSVFLGLIDKAEKNIMTKSKGGFMFTTIANIDVKPIDWLIDDFVESKALVEVFGAPESGKSLLAIDWGLSVAAGVPWCGHKTQQGAVFYIAGEGHNGLSRRFSAWGKHNAVDQKALPFYPSLQPAAFYNKQSAIDVERSIASMAKENGAIPRLVIVDTLARNFGGGNENSTEDMSLFVAHVDAHLRLKFNCTVLLVHHTGHGAAERGRGSSALKAAVDTEYSMNKHQNGAVINLACTKMKDASHPAPKSFTIAAIDLGIQDEKGHIASGAVLQETTYTAPEPKEKPLPDNQVDALELLERLYDEHRQNFIGQGKNPDDAKVTEKYWREQLGDVKSYTFRDIKSGLLKRDMINLEDGFVYLN